MIRVNDDYVILVDSLSYDACIDKHTTDKSGKPVYKPIGYYPNLELALQGIIKDMNAKKLGEGTYSLQEAIEVINASNEVFTEMLKEALGNGSNGNTQ